MADLGGSVRGAVREGALSWTAVVMEPGRFLRHGGVPLLLALALQLWIGVTDPIPADAMAEGGDPAMEAWVARNVWFLLAWVIFSIWATIRLMVQTTRWAMTGEPGAGFLEPAFGASEFRYFGWSILVGLATIPAVMLMSFIAMTLAGAGGVAFGVGSGGDAEAGGFGAGLMAVIGTLIGYAAVTFVLARLLPGLVPVAFGRPGALVESWRKSGAVAGYGAALVYTVLAPVLLFSLLLSDGGMFTPAETLLTLIGYIAYAALALAIVRFWYRAGEPGRE
ncbi:hypothetical protein [Indioceanicola profundi]|uniref:hypothetical protein n=1 Tax=Indioceanicola profundi TaxID=2220096 RepID=UPI000E6AD34C|nr:hypothetical protein [Indioceanicola profundi]